MSPYTYSVLASQYTYIHIWVSRCFLLETDKEINGLCLKWFPCLPWTMAQDILVLSWNYREAQWGKGLIVCLEKEYDSCTTCLYHCKHNDKLKFISFPLSHFKLSFLLPIIMIINIQEWAWACQEHQEYRCTGVYRISVVTFSNVIIMSQVIAWQVSGVNWKYDKC